MGNHHAGFHSQYGGLDKKYLIVNAVLTKFIAEMRGQGVWDSVVVQTISDFGRTLVYNGRGTDHSWGGNHITMGGKVRGGQMLGHFPSLDLDASPLILDPRRGSLIPTTPWEGIWRPLATWFGLSDASAHAVMPNLANFPPSMVPTVDDFFRPD